VTWIFTSGGNWAITAGNRSLMAVDHRDRVRARLPPDVQLHARTAVQARDRSLLLGSVLRMPESRIRTGAPLTVVTTNSLKSRGSLHPPDGAQHAFP
jgi:hypothetical protein